MNPLTAVIAGAIGYLLGSISFARLVAHWVAPGTDITKWVEPIPNSDLVYEDDAVSATLVNLHVGARYGCLTSILDMLKAIVPMLAFRQWEPEQPYYLVVSATALVGHNWPLYHGFAGGRGESVVYGSMLVIDPIGPVVANVAAVFLGLLLGHAHLIRWSGMLLLIPWLWFRTGDLVYLTYIVFVNIVFWISMYKDVQQFYLFQKQGVFRNQEELTDFLDMSSGLGRFMDRYSLPALFKRLAH